MKITRRRAAHIRGLLFDKDGTLVDFNATWLAVAGSLALDAAAGDRRKADRLLRQVGFDPATNTFAADSIFAAGTTRDVIDAWFPDSSEERRTTEARRFDDRTFLEGATRAVALPGVTRAVGALRTSGYRLGVASNDSTKCAQRTLEVLGIARFFDIAYGYDAVDRPKPAPDAVRAFADLTGLRPAQIAVVGDNRHDLEMARAAGCGLAIGVTSGNGTRPSLAPLADLVLPSVADLPKFLERQIAP